MNIRRKVFACAEDSEGNESYYSVNDTYAYNDERIYSVPMTEEEYALFSDFCESYYSDWSELNGGITKAVEAFRSKHKDNKLKATEIEALWKKGIDPATGEKIDENLLNSLKEASAKANTAYKRKNAKGLDDEYTNAQLERDLKNVDKGLSYADLKRLQESGAKLGREEYRRKTIADAFNSPEGLISEAKANAIQRKLHRFDSIKALPGKAMDWIKANPGKSAAIGAGTAVGLGTAAYFGNKYLKKKREEEEEEKKNRRK